MKFASIQLNRQPASARTCLCNCAVFNLTGPPPLIGHSKYNRMLLLMSVLRRWLCGCLTIYMCPIETHFNSFANRANPYQAAQSNPNQAAQGKPTSGSSFRAVLLGSTLFAYGNMIVYDPTLVGMTRNCFVLCQIVKVYLNKKS